MNSSHEIASSKVGSEDRLSRWYDFYAMFSAAFADSVFDTLSLGEGAVCLDPWLGSGTTTAVAAARGFRAVGFDVNPVMAVISRGRVCPLAKAKQAREVLLDAHGDPPSEIAHTDPLLNWLTPGTARRLRHWETCIRRPDSPLDHFSQDYLLTAVFGVMKQLCSGHRSKNPTWYKLPAPSLRTKVASRKLSDLLVTALDRLERLLPKRRPRFTPNIQVGDATHTLLGPASVDAVLTSPPYCTRIDYAVGTRPELAVLNLTDDTVGQLRQRTMGTSTIRPPQTGERTHWGDSCRCLLELVANHPSKASATYYLKTLEQYFSDLWRSLGQIELALKPGGVAVVVVQDSYYKGAHIDLARITEEMAGSHGWSAFRRDRFAVTSSMRRVNSRSRRYLDQGECVETALWFRTRVSSP